MGNDKTFYHLVLNSIDYFYLFQLDTQGCLSYKIYDYNYKLIEKEIMIKKHVLHFAAALDDTDNINLIVLMKTGELYHKIYKNKIWISSIIGKYNTQSNRYNKFEILFLNNKLNIIYSYSNLINSNIFTIHHIIYDNVVEEQHYITKYISTKGDNPFVIDYDDLGTIHLLYNSITHKESYIYHCFYSPYRKSWSIDPNELSKEDSQNFNPYLFIDSFSNIHCLWLEKTEKGYKLKYKKMATKGKYKYLWNEINIPYNFPKGKAPIIFEEDGNIKVIYNDLKEVNYINISNSKTPLSRSNISPTNTSIIKISISNKLYSKTKVNDFYGKVGNNPDIEIINKIYSWFQSENKEAQPLIINKVLSTQEKDEEKDSKNSNEINLENKEDLIKAIKELKKNQEELSSMVNNLISQEKLIKEEFNKLQNTLEKDKTSIFSRWFK